MISHIKLLRDVGVFYNVTVSSELKKIVLIYAENASGKTTLAEVLRSLETGDSFAVARKIRFGARGSPQVVLECDNQLKVMFKDKTWTDKLPDVRVFDEAFVTDNVYSGLDVEAEHRRNLHDLALGRQGVHLSRNRKELSQIIEQYNSEMRLAKKAIPDSQRGEFSMDEFCDLEMVPDIDSKISNAKVMLEAVKNAEDVLKTPVFEQINLPEFDEPAIRAILEQDLKTLDAEAAASVTRHIESLGKGGESWVNDGMRYVSDDNCPFCGQSVADTFLVKHYRAYFSEAYKNLKRDIEDILSRVCDSHSSSTQTTFERIVGENNKVGYVWAEYDLQMPNINTKIIVNEWESTLDVVKGMLEAKRDAPLERIPWNSNSLRQYEHHRHEIKVINDKIGKYNEEINRMKKNVDATTVRSAHDRLTRLLVIKERYSPSTTDWCNKYINARAGKKEATEKQNQVTRQLVKYRRNVFPRLQNGVNDYLGHFGVRYEMDGLKPTNVRGGSTCNYNVCINNASIGANKPKSNENPSIGSTLSTSDRNTLALAFFFASLKENNLANTILVIDDPVSSFDDNRSMATVQELRRLAKEVGQMIILSHKSAFLNKIWQKIDQNECMSLTIVRNDDGSTIQDWDIDQKANAEQATRQCLLEAYAKNKTGDHINVARTIRPYLETVLEAMCAGHYNGSKQVGSFIGECKNLCGTSNEILDRETVNELRDIIEYAGQFMHGSLRNSESQEINTDELHTYVKRTLVVTRLRSGSHYIRSDA